MTRRYPGQEKCPIARTLGVVGESWTFLLLREFLLKGERRFTDLKNAFPSMSPNILSARLKSLENHGVLERQLHDDHPPRVTYMVTGKGAALQPILDALDDWGTEFTE